MRRARTLELPGAAAISGLAFLVGYAWPLAAILLRSVNGVAGRDGLGADALRSALTDGRLGRVAGFTVGQAVVSTALCLAIGVPVGWVLARLRFPGDRVAAVIVVAPFVLPTLAVATSLLALVGGLPASRSGRFVLIVVAHVVFNVGVVARATINGVAQVDRSLIESASIAGRSPAAVWWSVSRPLVARRLAPAVLIVFVFCLTSFGVVVALGGAGLTTVEVEIWSAATQTLDLSRASVLAGLQLLLVIALVVVGQRLAVPTVAGTGTLRRRPRGIEWGAVAAVVAVVAALGALPVGVLVARSVSLGEGAWGLDAYRSLAVAGSRSARAATGSDGLGPVVIRSIVAAVFATAATMVVALAVASVASGANRSARWVERLAILPLATSSVTLGLGALIGFGTWGIDLRGTPMLVVLGQTAVAVPVAVGIVLPAARSLDPSLRDAAATLGAHRRRRVGGLALPLMRRSLSTAAMFAFALSMGDFGATVILARGDAATLPIVIGRLAGRPGPESVRLASAASVVLVLACIGPGLTLVLARPTLSAMRAWSRRGGPKRDGRMRSTRGAATVGAAVAVVALVGGSGDRRVSAQQGAGAGTTSSTSTTTTTTTSTTTPESTSTTVPAETTTTTEVDPFAGTLDGQVAELGYSGQSVFDPASRAVLIDQLAAARERLTDATSARQAAENALAASINDVASAEQQAAASGATTQTQVVHAAEAKERLRKRVVESYVLGDRRLDIYTVVDDPVTFSQARTYLESITAAENDAMAQYRQAVAALDSVQRQLVDQIAALRRAATERQAAVDLTGVLQLQAMSEVASYEAGSHVYVPGFRMPVAGPAHFIDSWGFPRMAGTAKAHWHEGIDIMAPVGRELVATEPGTIFKVGTVGLGGLRLWLRGDSGTEYYYAHLSAVAPGIADDVRVAAGDVVGFVGDSGNASGGPAHLHFEIHPGGGAAVNPFPLIKTAWGAAPIPTQAEALAGPVRVLGAGR